MASVKQTIEATLTKRVDTVIQSRLLTAVRAGANGVRDDMLRTARSGITPKGSSMPAYSERYKKAKGKYIATGKYGKRTLKRTSSAATSVNDKTVLTGHLHQSIVVKSVKAKQDSQGFIQASFTIGTNNTKAADKWEWLMGNGYPIGVATGGAAKARQRKIFLKELQRTLGFKGGAASLSEA